MDDFNLWKILYEVAPIVLVLGYGYWLMFGLYKDERKANTELQNYIRQSDKSNLDLLKDFQTLLNTILATSDSNRDKIIQVVSSEAKEIKLHVDTRVRDIEKRAT